MKSNFKTALAFAVLCAIHSAFAQYKVVLNPYESVDWGTYGKHKAAFHVHTTNSDGTNTVKDMLLTHYDRDFSIVTITDHGRFNEDWTKDPEKGAPDEGDLADWSSSSKAKENLDVPTKNQINNGSYSDSKIKNRNTSLGGMIGLKCGGELLAYKYMYSANDTYIDVGHSFTANACFTYSGKDSLTKILKLSAAEGGVNYIHHPGRYTNGGYTSDSAAGAAISNNPIYIDKYVKMLKETDALGMEIINKLDNESKSDRVLYDNILKALAPEGRKVWAFSSDDSHSLDEIGYSYNVMLLDKLTEEATVESMRKGTFYAVARVDRREGIHITTPKGKPTPERGNTTEETTQWLKETVPSISKIAVDKESGTITISGDDFSTIEWISDGVKILSESRNAAGNTLNLNSSAYEGKIGRYVRAHLKSNKGIAYTQPFYVQNPNVKVNPWYTKPTGLTGTGGDELSSVELPTVADGKWTWVNGEQDIEEGTLPYRATFTPTKTDIYNVVTVDLNVIGTERGSNIYEVSKFGDYYYYQSKTQKEFLTDAFNMSSLNGWTNAPTSMGFGTTPTPTTKIPNGPNENTNYTWTYFKKQFTIDNKNFDASKITSVFGQHQIDDAMIMYINGTEVYRFNTSKSSSSTKIGDDVNWGDYAAGNTVQAATRINFAIDKDYPGQGISSGSSTYHAASLTNLKSALKPGVNVITCVVGQAPPTSSSSSLRPSSDLFFDLQMSIKEKNDQLEPFTNIKEAVLKSDTIYTYNGNPQKPALMLGGKELKEGKDYTVANGTNNINASSAEDKAIVEIIGIGDYIGNASFVFDIAPKPVTITASANDKVYDGNKSATIKETQIISGVIGNDDLTVKQGTASFDSPTVGERTVTFSDFGIEGADASNYTLSAQPTSVTANITPSSSSSSSVAPSSSSVAPSSSSVAPSSSSSSAKSSSSVAPSSSSSSAKSSSSVAPSSSSAKSSSSVVSSSSSVAPSSSSSSAKSSSSVAPSSSSSSAKSSSSVAPSSSSSSAKSSSSVAPSSSSSSAKSSSSVAPSSSSAKSSSSVVSSSSSVAPSSSSSVAPSSSSSVVSSSSSIAPSSSSSSAKSSSSVAPSSSSAKSSSSVVSSSSSTVQPVPPPPPSPPVVEVDKCGTSTINYDKQFCYNDKVYSLCNGSEYDPEYEKCSGGALQYKCGKSSWYNDEKQFCWEDEKGGKVYSLCGGSSYDPETEKCQSGAVVSKTTPVLPPQVASLGNILVHTTTNTILLSNLPQGSKVEVYNLQGKQIYSTTSYSPLAASHLRIEVQTGVYIVKINSQTLRIAVK